MFTINTIYYNQTMNTLHIIDPLADPCTSLITSGRSSRRCLRALRHRRSHAGMSRQRLCQPQALLQNVLPLAWRSKDGVKAAREELLGAILEGRVPRSRVDELVDTLIAARVPFKESMLGGGPWEVCYTRGALLWQQATQPAQLTSPGRKRRVASQDFDPGNRTVINMGELLGPSLYVTAEGTYQPLPDNDPGKTPKEIEARVSSGTLHALGVQIPLPIRGSGRTTLVYIDDTIRIFQTVAGIAVQIKQSRLPR